MLRTHNCGELNKQKIAAEVTLCGWASTRRDHGGVIFIDLRDRYGITQIVFDPSHNTQSHSNAEHVGREWVIQVSGHVRHRPDGQTNAKIPTGEIELLVDSITILNRSETPPFEIDERVHVGEELRLKYRYLDLRREGMKNNMLLRHNAAQAAREYLTHQKFVEIETPLLVRTTPGGARVYKVPSRVHPGKCFTLPESPQVYKQLLMIAGMDRYFQLAKCLRDEDLRADRQPEFTQIDMELSFVNEEDVMDLVEGTIKHMMSKALNVDIKEKFPIMTWQHAMSKYGSDKPDLRFGLEFENVSEIVKHAEFGVFKSVVDKGGVVFCLNAKGAGKFSRKEIDALIEVAKRHGLGGLAWMKMTENGLESNIVKYFQDTVQKQLVELTKAQRGDLLLFSAADFERAAEGLGQVRLEVGKKLELINPKEFKFAWIVDFPLFEFDKDTNTWAARHHIFTMPKDEDMDKLKSSPETVKGKLYDCILNGWELGSGSIRIHNKEIQQQVLEVVGLTYEQAEKRFDFLLDAFKFGAPPHGGFAIGFDRLVTLMGHGKDIRDFIAFPRNKSTENPMDGSPQEFSNEFLKELELKLDIVKKPTKP